MEHIKRYRVSGIPGAINRVSFNGRLVDYWAPKEKTSHLLIAHDGQNIFDWRTSSRKKSWRLAQRSIRVSKELGIAPPVIIAVFHSRNPQNPWGRILDLTPQDPFQQGVQPPEGTSTDLKADELMGNIYLEQIIDSIVPTIIEELRLGSDQLDKAVIGSSMGGLAALYALTKRPHFFTTSLALSTHWSAGEFALVEALIDKLPEPGNHKIWMSHGTRGLDAHYSPFQERANEKMKSAGWILGENYMTRIYRGARHNERAWSRQIDQPLRFWLKGN